MSGIINEISAAVRALPQKDRVIIAIDGRCASGKTTLARRLGEKLGAAVFHMDDYFLRQEQRTRERLDIPGENVDHERFLREILLPLKNGDGQITYRPYDCGSRSLMPPVSAAVDRLAIVEGAYSCHPTLSGYYDLRIFLTVSPDEQLRRITERNGAERALVFRNKWIPLEEKYFAELRVEEQCGLSFDNTITE